MTLAPRLVVPGAMLATAIAIICLAYYPISRSSHQENIRRLGAAPAE